MVNRPLITLKACARALSRGVVHALIGHGPSRYFKKQRA
jgi:hypothetical protein